MPDSANVTTDAEKGLANGMTVVVHSRMTAEVHLRPFQVAVSSTPELEPVRTEASPTHLRAAGHDNAVRAGTLR